MKTRFILMVILASPLLLFSNSSLGDEYPRQCATYSPAYTFTAEECDKLAVRMGAPYFIWNYKEWVLKSNDKGFQVKAAKCLLCSYKYE